MKKTVEVTITVEVTLDKKKFSKRFIREFQGYMYPFDSIQEHIEHLAQLEARGLMTPFIEGYGPAKDMGIKTKIIDQHQEIID